MLLVLPTDTEVIITGSIRVYCIRACNLPPVHFRLADNAPVLVQAPANHSIPRRYSTAMIILLTKTSCDSICRFRLTDGDILKRDACIQIYK